MPRINSEKNSPYRSGNRAPMVRVRRVISMRAAACGMYCRRSAAARMRWLVSAVTPLPPFMARDTEATDTLAARATSLMVAELMWLSSPAMGECVETLPLRQRKRFHGDL
jgi:hypothetical protein